MTTTQSPTPAASGLELPELPEPKASWQANPTSRSKLHGQLRTGPLFTADQMHAYARQALAAQPAPVVGGGEREAVIRKLRCLGPLLQQLNAQEAAKAVADAIGLLSTRPAESVAQTTTGETNNG